MDNHTQDDEIKAKLLATNEQFRNLNEQHAQLKRQVEEIERKSHVTEADEFEEQRLKKLKLYVKDQMNGLLTQHRNQGLSWNYQVKSTAT